MAHELVTLLGRYGLWIAFGNVLVRQLGVPVPAPPVARTFLRCMALIEGRFVGNEAVWHDLRPRPRSGPCLHAPEGLLVFYEAAAPSARGSTR
jgi:hypothetical protein